MCVCRGRGEKWDFNTISYNTALLPGGSVIAPGCLIVPIPSVVTHTSSYVLSRVTTSVEDREVQGGGGGGGGVVGGLPNDLI